MNEIETPSKPHECRCTEVGADGSREHYVIVADIKSKMREFPICVNHIGNYALYPDTYRITVLPKYADNPRVGQCAYCSASIWASNERIEDSTGMHHAVCKVAVRLRDMERWERVALDALGAIRNMNGPDYILGDAVSTARWALANRKIAVDKPHAERLKECLEAIQQEELPGTPYIAAKRYPELQALLKEGTPFIK